MFIFISEVKGMCICFKRNTIKYCDDYDDDDDVFGVTSDNEDFYE